jgi:dipeptidyl aminopeptidase/acylaminoacyl peptidase
MPTAANVAFVPPGFLVFRLGDRLMAQEFNWLGSRLTGEAVQVAEIVAGTDMVAYFSAVPDALAYIPGTAMPMALTWLDRKGNRLGTVGEPGEYSGPALSPDGRTLAVSRRDPATQMRDIWLIDLARGTQSRFTFDPADEFNPAWSPDGSRIAFTSARSGQRDIYEKAASGIREDRLVLGSDIEKNMEYWSPDGRLLLFNVLPGNGTRQIWALPLQGESKPYAVITGPADIQSSPLSPDGKFIAYSSTESKRFEIYIQDFPPTGKRWSISTAGGTNPQWRPDGKELFYIAGAKLMAVDVKIGGSRLEPGIPHALFEAPFATAGRNMFVPSRDGQRFLAILQVEHTGSPSITVELNWMSRLKQ